MFKDSSLIRQLKLMAFWPEQSVLLSLADGADPGPSINIESEDGVKALQCFMAEHSSILLNMQPKYLKLVRFVIENNYVNCNGMEGLFLIKICTAIGTSFSVKYASIFMIWS